MPLIMCVWVVLWLVWLCVTILAVLGFGDIVVLGESISVTEAEASAILIAVQSTRFMGYENVIFKVTVTPWCEVWMEMIIVSIFTMSYWIFGYGRLISRGVNSSLWSVKKRKQLISWPDIVLKITFSIQVVYFYLFG